MSAADYAAETQLAQLRELHKPYGVYDECGHRHSDDEPGVVDCGEYLTCAEAQINICTNCCMGESYEQTEDCANRHIHGKDLPICATRTILDVPTTGGYW